MNKLFNSDPWNFDTKNVKHTTIREKWFQVMKMKHQEVKAWFFFAFDNDYPVVPIFHRFCCLLLTIAQFLGTHCQLPSKSLRSSDGLSARLPIKYEKTKPSKAHNNDKFWRLEMRPCICISIRPNPHEYASSWLDSHLQIKSHQFLVADTQLYRRRFPSVHPSVRP